MPYGWTTVPRRKRTVHKLRHDSRTTSAAIPDQVTSRYPPHAERHTQLGRALIQFRRWIFQPAIMVDGNVKINCQKCQSAWPLLHAADVISRQESLAIPSELYVAGICC